MDVDIIVYFCFIFWTSFWACLSQDRCLHLEICIPDYPAPTVDQWHQVDLHRHPSIVLDDSMAWILLVCWHPSAANHRDIQEWKALFSLFFFFIILFYSPLMPIFWLIFFLVLLRLFQSYCVPFIIIELAWALYI